MKKLLAISASVILATTVFAFSGCGGSKGEISGNYKDATQEEVLAEIEKIDEEKVFDAVKGFESSAQFDLSYVMGESKGSASATESFKLTYEVSESGVTLAGSGNGSVKYSATGEGESTSGNYSAKVYIDSESVYFDLTGDMELKGKIGVESIFNMIGDFLPIAVEEDDYDDDYDYDYGYDYGYDDANIFDMFENISLKYSMDTSNGLKIKVSVPQDSIWEIIESTGSAGSQIATMKSMLKFDTYKLDAYLALDSEGTFSQLSLDIDVAVSADYSSLPAEAQGPDMSLKLSGYFVLKAYDGKVTLPSGLATDNTYIDLSGMLG